MKIRNLNETLNEYQINLPISEKKQSLRKLMLSERTQLAATSSPQNWGTKQFLRSLEILKIPFQDLQKEDEQRGYRIASYFPIKGELEISQFASKNWLFPKISPQDRELKWFLYGDGKTGYITNKFGIPEHPNCFSYDKEMLPLICFVPGLVASQDGYRLGYGGGYYDRFLNKMKTQVTSVFCIPSENFLFDTLPFDEHDEKVDLVVF